MSAVTRAWFAVVVRVKQSYEIPRSRRSSRMSWLKRSAISRGDTPSRSAVTITGVPCSSVPLTIRTSSPFKRWYRAKMSAGTANPTTCPRCLRPDAYGQAGATRIFFFAELSDMNVRLRLGEGHDTSRLLRRTPSPRAREGQDQHQRAQNEGPGMVALPRRRRLGHRRDEPRRLLRLVLEGVRGPGRRPPVMALGRRGALVLSRRCLDAVPLRDPHRDTRKGHPGRAERDGGAWFLVDMRARSRPGLRHSLSRRRLDACADRHGDGRRCSR